MKPDIAEAVSAIDSVTNFSTENGKIVGWDISEKKTNNPQPTEEAIQTELDRLLIEWTAQEYARNRASAFPSIGDQLDMQYHDQLDGTTTWKDAIAKVKSDNPKE